MSTSVDGGQTWQAARATADNAPGIGGQPVVQPDGTVVVPYVRGANVRSFSSHDGGASWSSSVVVANVTAHRVAGKLRTSPLPSAEVDGAGTVYVAWQDCRFRNNCSANDIVLTTCADGVTWSAPARIPIDGVTSHIDHFIPGLAVDPATAGATAHLVLAYYDYPAAKCTVSTCQLSVGAVTSVDGGASWSAPIALAGPMKLGWLPNTSQGLMVGDYISTSFVGGVAFPAIEVAAQPSAGNSCSQAPTACNQALFTVAGGLTP